MSTYVGYWYSFGEQHPILFKAMRRKLEGAKNESDSSSPNTQLSTSVTNERKTIDIYEERAHENEQMLAKSLQIQTEAHQLQKKRAAIAEKQLGVFQAAFRMEGMSTWMGKIKDLTKEYKLLKKIQNQCGRNSDGEKQNWRARRKAHEKRVKQRGDNFGRDSSDSEGQSCLPKMSYGFWKYPSRRRMHLCLQMETSKKLSANQSGSQVNRGAEEPRPLP
jgi:hypothetical protein